MKGTFILWGTLGLGAFLLPLVAFGEEKPSPEYVYIIQSEGGKVFRMIEPVTAGGKETVKQEIRRMELIPAGSTLEIEAGASVFLTCAGCNTVNFTHKNSPLVIRMEDFSKKGSATGPLVQFFTSALKNFIHVDSKRASRVQLATRTGKDAFPNRECQTLWPPDRADIMPIDPIVFKWELKGNNFLFSIKDLGSKERVYRRDVSSPRIEVPAQILKPGRRYEWLVEDQPTKEKCGAAFKILTEVEFSNIMKVIEELPNLLPYGSDSETKCRLQAGYLLSEGYTYDAWQWLERNGIK